MSKRRPLIIGNWKMNLSLGEAQALASSLLRRFSTVHAGPELFVCPSHLHLHALAPLLDGSVLGLGAQDLAAFAPGPHTGGSSGEQLRELGVRLSLVGHSERRNECAEADEMVAAKLRAAFRVGLIPVLCFGETRAEREAGRTEDIVHRQLSSALDGLADAQIAATVLAYEPVWAIGTGLHAAVDDVVSVHQRARAMLRELGGPQLAEAVRILYGGSVNGENVGAYLAEEAIDGALVGGASLDADAFWNIVCWHDGAV
ncbi:MAG TPA: triose-phosphate isomerase [Candidatus Krumholzibacteria bacterium]